MTMKRILCSSLAVICVAASCVSCGSKDKDDFLGKWECEKIVMGGEEMDNFFGVEAYALYQIELKEGNKGTVDSAFSTDGKPVDLTWEKQKDGKIKLTNDEAFDGEEAVLEKDGKKMVMSVADDEDDEEGKSDEVKMYFVKVDSFKEMPENPFAGLGSDDDDTDADEDDAEEVDEEE